MAIPVRRLIPLLVALGCVLAGSVLGAVALPAVIARMEPEREAARPKPPPDLRERGVPLEPIEVMVNLSDEHGRRVLKAAIVLEARNAASKAELETRSVEVKHQLISLLSEKRLQDVEGKGEKEMLLRTIRLSLNERLGLPDAVIRVFFTQFIIQ